MAHLVVCKRGVCNPITENGDPGIFPSDSIELLIDVARALDRASGGEYQLGLVHDDAVIQLRDVHVVRVLTPR